MPALPTPLRAALGVVATVLDNAKDFPDKAIELPMLAVSTALQMSLRAQQRYAALAAKGDDLLSGRHITDEPPAWATFDEPRPAPSAPLKAAATKATAIKATSAPTRSTASKATATKATANKVTAAKATAAKATTTTATLATATATTTATPRTGPAKKTVRKPRGAAPSAFDTIGDED